MTDDFEAVHRSDDPATLDDLERPSRPDDPDDWRSEFRSYLNDPE